MFGTPTGSIFELMRSPPSVASHSHHNNNENNGMNAAGAALSRPSKSSASVASFNSSTRYQPSSSSTYSASTPAVAGSSPELFKRHYVTQAIRLVDDALMEQDKGSCCDESYALDCYLASLEYLLSAVPTETNLHRQIGSVDRQAIVHAKLINLIRRTEEFAATSHECDAASRSTEKATGWWNGVWRQKYSRRNAQDMTNILVSTPSELAAQCDCGRKILVKIPECFLSDPLRDRQPEVQKVEHRNFLVAWYGWALSLIFSAISTINGFVLPSLISLIIRTVFTIIVYFEKRYGIVNLILNFFVSMIKILLKISQDYNFNQRIGDFCSWLISKLLQVALAFVKKDDIKNLNVLFDLANVDQNTDHHDLRKIPVDANTRLNSFHVSQAPMSHQFNSKLDTGNSSSSSRFSRGLDSRGQLNHKDHKSSFYFTDKSPNASYCRTSRYGF